MPRFRRKIRTYNPFTDVRVWPTGPDQVANELEFSETYRDLSAPGEVAPPGAPPVVRMRLPRSVRERIEPGGIPENVPVGIAPATPVVRQARFVNLAATVGTTSVQLLAANQKRTYLIIINTLATTIFVTFDRPASISTGVPILGQGNYEPLTPPVSSVWAISTGTNIPVVIVEGTT